MKRTLKLTWYWLLSLVCGCTFMHENIIGGEDSLFGKWSEESVVGDTFSECQRKERGRLTIRDGSDLGDEVWAEWTQGNPCPFPRIAFDRAEWQAYHKTVTIAGVRTLAWDLKTGAVEVNGQPVERAPEPRAKWVHYDWGSFRGMEPR